MASAVDTGASLDLVRMVFPTYSSISWEVVSSVASFDSGSLLLVSLVAYCFFFLGLEAHIFCFCWSCTGWRQTFLDKINCDILSSARLLKSVLRSSWWFSDTIHSFVSMWVLRPLFVWTVWRFTNTLLLHENGVMMSSEESDRLSFYSREMEHKKMELIAVGESA